MLKNILYLSIFTTVVIVVSVILSIYHNFTAMSSSGDSSIQVVAIPGKFDFQTVAEIKTRKVVPVDLTLQMPETNTSSQSSSLTPQATPVIIPTQTIPATSSSQINTIPIL